MSQTAPAARPNALHFAQLRGMFPDEDRRLDAYGLDRLRALASVTIIEAAELAEEATLSNRLVASLLAGTPQT